MASKIEELEVVVPLMCGCMMFSYPKIERYDNYEKKIYVRGYHKTKHIAPNPDVSYPRCTKHFPDPADKLIGFQKDIFIQLQSGYFTPDQADVLVDAIKSRVRRG